ncbi:serine/threonine-protein kinase [Cylindrospermum stagnale]|uniref:serine/threonine-protein kinase n=1 Tax=Cylindrospermum stagnale TaxID=142864 RepID=UPI00031E598F|nr:serine/threonine-protein kinase [Cylindrospermum stagnale]
MSRCINPNCQNPDNPDNLPRCQSCGSELLLEGRYRVTRLLSDKGGFGKTFEVIDRNGIPKVLKVLKKNTPKAVEQFQREAKVLRRLNHPGIPQGEDDFTFYPKNTQTPVYCLVMEKIEGENLHDWLENRSNRPINEKTAVDWLIQIANTLHELHQQQPPLIHRDIKPSNIMLKPDGYLVLIDFGIAREVTQTYEQKLSEGAITTTHTPGYAPLEQVVGQAVPQSDFFALGRTFVYLLTGKQPDEIGNNYCDPNTDDEWNWREKYPDISDLLADFIDDLMARSVNKRPADTKIILQSLKEIEQALYPQKLSQPLSAYPLPQINGQNIYLKQNLGGRWDSPGHAQAVTCIAISPNGQTLVSGSNDATIRLWDISSGEQIRTFSHSRQQCSINSLVIGLDGETLISANDHEGYLEIFNIDTGEKIRNFRASMSPVKSLIISPDGQTLFSGSYKGIQV